MEQKNKRNAASTSLSLLSTAADRNRTGTKFNPRRILSPVRLPIPPRRRHDNRETGLMRVDGGGFEPPKRVATDLQSAPFGHSGIHPDVALTVKNHSTGTQKKQALFPRPSYRPSTTEPTGGTSTSSIPSFTS